LIAVGEREAVCSLYAGKEVPIRAGAGGKGPTAERSGGVH